MVPHLKLISSLKPTHLLQLAVFCQSAIVISSRLGHPRYIRYTKCPNTDPCATPLKTNVQFETCPSTTTRSLLSDSHCSNQSIRPSPIPLLHNRGIIHCLAKSSNYSLNLCSSLEHLHTSQQSCANASSTS